MEDSIKSYISKLHLFGAASTLALTFIYYEVCQIFNLTQSGSILFVMIAIAGYYDGLIPALLTAIWITLYMYFIADVDTIDRIIQVALGATSIAIFMGICHHRALVSYKAKTFNNTLILVNKLDKYLSKEGDELSSASIRAVKDNLEEVATLTWGFKKKY